MARAASTYRANKPAAGKIRGQVRLVGPKGQKRDQHPRRALDRATFKSMQALQRQREAERAAADQAGREAGGSSLTDKLPATHEPASSALFSGETASTGESIRG
jgi:hypothetical protein